MKLTKEKILDFMYNYETQQDMFIVFPIYCKTMKQNDLLIIMALGLIKSLKH